MKDAKSGLLFKWSCLGIRQMGQAAPVGAGQWVRSQRRAVPTWTVGGALGKTRLRSRSWGSQLDFPHPHCLWSRVRGSLVLELRTKQQILLLKSHHFSLFLPAKVKGPSSIIRKRSIFVYQKFPYAKKLPLTGFSPLGGEVSSWIKGDY